MIQIKYMYKILYVCFIVNSCDIVGKRKFLKTLKQMCIYLYGERILFLQCFLVSFATRIVATGIYIHILDDDMHTSDSIPPIMNIIITITIVMIY